MNASLYPIALDLAGKRVLVVGGGRLAARKLPELLRCGADITLVAPHLHPAVARMQNALRHIARGFMPGDENGHVLAFTLTDNAEVNALVGGLCRKQGIWCNRADAAGEGDFQVPGVIRRGPVTLTAATGGAVPGLTRLLKRHLDGLFGDELPLLAEVMGEWRRKARLALGSGNDPTAEATTRSRLEALPYADLLVAARQGRQTLEAALEQAWSAGQTSEAKTGTTKLMETGVSASLGTLSSTHPSAQPQPVVLLGAGPGHPAMLTLLGAEALKQAEVLLHDRLIPPEILDLVPAACLRIPVEKRGHHESMRQEHINAHLIAHARSGKKVVRLKGGDPFVFGRGYEEILALEAQGLPWTVVPGVSSALAAPAWAGIPLTHRGMARSFAVMTGTAYDHPDPEIPEADTLVVLMGLQRLPTIVQALLNKGYAASTPAAAIEKGTRSDQRVIVGSLENLVEITARSGFDSPTLIVIGAVAALAKPTPA